VVEDFQETILILEPMKTVQRLHKENKAEKKRLETKQPDWKFDFQRAKEYQKNRKEIKDLEVQKLHSSNCSRTKKYRIMTQKKTKELEKISIIRLKTEKNAGLSFLLK
jgi:hypothetical protein